MAARVDYVFARVGSFGNRRDSRGGFETQGDAIAMAARGAILEVPPGPQGLSRRTRALLAAALLSLALAATAYMALRATGPAGRATGSRGFSQAGLLSLPLAARGPASAAVGSYQPGYAVRPQGSGLTAWSAAQRLSSGFSSAGVSVRSGRASLNMRLAGVGYGTALRPVPAAVPRASDNRVTYSRPGLQEWYANGPLGLEQGFTLARAPAGARRGPLTLALSLTGSAHAKLSSDGKSVDFGSSSAPLRYTGLAAEDASGRPLQSWLSLSSGKLLLHVRTAGARYPVRIDPFIQGTALKSSGGTAENKFGYSVALSGDGKTALVGAPYDEDGARLDGDQAGAAFVFVLSGSKWEQQGSKLTGTGPEEPIFFGYSVALNANGNTALVGAPETAVGGKQSEGYDQGAAYVFTRTGSEWKQQEVLLSGEKEHYVEFGWSVALSGSGNTALVGGPGFGGHAWTFKHEGSWKQQATLKGNPKSEFGYSVALSGNGGNTALIGAPKEVGGEGGGAAFVYTLAAEWKKTAEIKGSGEGSEFGYSVALSGNGGTGLIGAPEHNHPEGAAYVVTASTGWKEPQELHSQAYFFGGHVALSGEGTTALIGRTENGGGVWAYTDTGGKWTLSEELSGSSESADFGPAVALDENGQTALVGSSFLGGGNSAWPFSYEAPSFEVVKEQRIKGEAGYTTATLKAELTVTIEYKITVKNNGKATLHFGALKDPKCTNVSPSGETTLKAGESELFTCEHTLSGGDENPYKNFAVITGSGVEKISNVVEVSIEGLGTPPEAVTSAASEVTKNSAQLNGTVNPHGKEVTECKFEYGTTVGYGSSMACGSLPGKGEAPVAVSAAVSGLSPNTVYHFRVVAKTSAGTSHGEDETFTTLMTSATGESTKEGETAKAKDEGLSVQASEGTGKVTIGPYGSNIGGPPLADSHGTYLQVYHSEGASFKKMEYEDCELGGAKAIWWENPATGWEAIQEPVAVYDEETKCIKVTATESTTPSIAQLSDPRHVGGPSAKEQYGKCEPTKHGHFEDAMCTKEKYTEKGQVKSYKGKYEWLPEPVGCFAMKKGHYADGGCTQEDFSENKKTHEKKYKGSYEKGVNSFKVASGSVVFAAPSQSSVQCVGSSSTSGLLRGVNQSSVTLTLTGCERAGAKCTSTGETPGTIVSQPLESYSYEEGDEYFTTLAGRKGMLTFSCSTTEFRLSGAAAGLWKVSLNAPNTSTEATFSEEVGAQELELEETKTQSRYFVTLTTKTTTTTEQPVEIKVGT